MKYGKSLYKYIIFLEQKPGGVSNAVCGNRILTGADRQFARAGKNKSLLPACSSNRRTGQVLKRKAGGFCFLYLIQEHPDWFLFMQILLTEKYGLLKWPNELFNLVKVGNIRGKSE